MNNTIALITPTGGRPNQMQLCMQWMKQQTYVGNVLWIIVDDCEPKTTQFIPEDFKDNWKIIHKYPKPSWKFDQNTQCRNLQVGVQEVLKHGDVSIIFIIEDDDYYKPNYLECMFALMREFDVCGEIKTLYYNVKLHLYKRCSNINHSSLFQTAFSIKMVPVFLQILNTHVRFIDIEFYKKSKNVFFFNGLDLAVGIKGIPGRSGIGTGHNETMYPKFQKDIPIENRKQVLKNIIGEDSKYYLNT